MGWLAATIIAGTVAAASVAQQTHGAIKQGAQQRKAHNVQRGAQMKTVAETEFNRRKEEQQRRAALAQRETMARIGEKRMNAPQGDSAINTPLGQVATPEASKTVLGG